MGQKPVKVTAALIVFEGAGISMLKTENECKSKTSAQAISKTNDVVTGKGTKLLGATTYVG